MTARLAAGVTALLAVALGYAGAAVGAVALAVPFLVAGVVLLWRVQSSWLPGLALLAFAAFPVQFVPVPTGYGTVSPALLVVLVLLARVPFEQRPIARGAHVLPLLLLSGYVLVQVLASPIRATSAAWALNFLVLVTAVGLLLPGWPEARERLERCWIGAGAGLGAYAVLEFALQANPLMDPVYAAVPGGLVQGWETYRVTTTLGHPLANGLFFAIAAMLALGRARFTSARTLLPAGLCLLGALLSGSRGALLALAAGLVVLVLGSAAGAVLRRRRGPSVVVLAVVGAGLVAGAALLLAQRAGGAEAAGSTATRLATYAGGEILAREHLPWGAGAGLADTLKHALSVGDARRGVESSWLQLLIALGIPGVVLALWLTVVAGLRSLVARPQVSAALAVYVVGAASFNLLETNRPALLLWGALIGLCAAGREPAADAGPDAEDDRVTSGARMQFSA